MNNDRRFQVYIQNLPYSCDEAELLSWCSNFGEVKYCQLKRDETGHSRGFAFVTFTSEEGFNNLFVHLPLSYGGRRLNVRASNAQMKLANEHESNSFRSPMENEIEYRTSENGDEELETNLELIQYEQQREIQRLELKLAAEIKLLQEQQETYRRLQEEWDQIVEANQQIRQKLLKNVVQTFNIKQRLARELKKKEKFLEDPSQSS